MQTTFYDIINSKIPKELSGYRMALFSDLHNNEIGHRSCELIEAIDALAPNVILVPGDAVNKSMNDKEAKGGYEFMLPLFAELSSRYPILYSNGNHEARLARLNKDGGYYTALQKVLKKRGVTILNNRSLYFRNRKLHFAGLDLPLPYYGKKHDPVDAAFLTSLLGEPDPDPFTVLLAQTPEFFKAYLDWGADLIVSGHIHGGVIRLPVYGGLLSPHRRLFPGYDYGSYKENGKEMIVSSGLAGPQFPPRILNPGELVLLTLYPSREDVPDATEC